MASTSSLPSFSSTFADVPRERERERERDYEMQENGRDRKRRHPPQEPDIKEEQDELEPSPPPERAQPSQQPKTKRRRLSLSAPAPEPHRPVSPPSEAGAASALESMRTKGRELQQQQQQQQQQHSENGSGAGDKTPTPWSRPPNSSNTPAAKRPAATLDPEPASPDTFPPLTSFATRRRQSQNSAGADKAAKLSIRPPPSPYQSSAGSEYKVNHLMPTIHSAPPAGWAMRQEQQQQQQQQRPPGGGAGGLKLPVVPPVFGARPGMPDTPRTAVPLPQRRPMFLNSPLPGRLTGGPRTAGLPSTHSHLSTQQQMGPPSAVPPRGGGGGYVQPIATARPSFGGGSSSNLDREKQAFLAPFESFYDTLADARRLKVWLAEQLQRSGQYDARVERLEREVDGLRRRVAELEGAPAGGSTNSNNGPHADLPPSPPTLHSHTSAVRLEPAPTPSRSAAPEPSPIPTALNGGGATPAAGSTLSPPLRMVGPRISSPRAPTHHAATASPQLPPNGLKKRMDVEGPARTASR